MERLWWSELETPIGRIGLGSSEKGLAYLLLPNHLEDERPRDAVTRCRTTALPC